MTIGKDKKGGRGAAQLGKADARLAGWFRVELSRVAQASTNDISNNLVMFPQTV